MVIVSDETNEFVEIWGEPSASVPVPQERFDQLDRQLPGTVFEFWREFGFAGFGNGLLWFCDPLVWQPAVDSWTRDLPLAMGPDRWTALTRTAFGELHLWGERTGTSLTVVPSRGWIFPHYQSAHMSSVAARDSQIYAALMSHDADSLDVMGEDGHPLFNRLLAAQGPVSSETMYGFVPALALGGPPRPDRVEIVDALVHMQLLSDITPRRIMGDVIQTPRWQIVRIDQTGLAGSVGRLLTSDPTDDAGWPADFPPGTTEVTIVDDAPGPLLTLRVHPAGTPSNVVFVRFDQLAVEG